MAIPGGLILQALFRPQRSIGDITAMVTISEDHYDEIGITEHPIERGASVADHAIVLPAELRIRAGWSKSPNLTGAGLDALASAVGGAINGIAGLTDSLGLTSINGAAGLDYIQETYAKFLALQRAREPITVYTGKRKYSDMMIQSLSTTTTAETENSMLLDIVLRQVNIVDTKPQAADDKKQAAPELTAAQKLRGAVQPVASKITGLFG